MGHICRQLQCRWILWKYRRHVWTKRGFPLHQRNTWMVERVSVFQIIVLPHTILFPSQIPGLRAIKKKIKGPTRAQRSRKGLTPAERFKAQLDKKEHELEEQHQFEEKQRQLEEQHRLQHQLEEQRKIEQQQQSSSPTPKPRKLTPRQSPDAANDAESPSSRRFRYRLTEPDNEQNLWSVNEDEFEWDEDAEEGQGKGSDNDEDEDDELAEQHMRAARQVEIMKTNAHTHKDDRRAHESHDVQPDRDAFKRRDKENEHKKAVMFEFLIHLFFAHSNNRTFRRSRTKRCRTTVAKRNMRRCLLSRQTSPPSQLNTSSLATQSERKFHPRQRRILSLLQRRILAALDQQQNGYGVVCVN